jgi:hypothetical protein
MRRLIIAKFLVLLSALPCLADRDGFDSLVADRAAVERVYGAHRLGSQPSSEQALPAAQNAALVRLDLKKKAILQRVYHFELGQAETDAEVQRINSTTRAPDVLAEIKHALGDDPKRFADTVAQPIVIERELRTRFANDAKLHAASRASAEKIRREVLAPGSAPERIALLKKRKDSSEIVWQLASRQTTLVRETASSASYSIETTTEIAQISNTADKPTGAKRYFADVDPELQKVIGSHLQKAGDVTPVIEMPDAFLLYVANERTDGVLGVVSLAIRKRDYDEWINQQKD